MTTSSRKIAARCIRLARSHGHNSLTVENTIKTLDAAYNIATDLYRETENLNDCVNIQRAMLILQNRETSS